MVIRKINFSIKIQYSVALLGLLLGALSLGSVMASERNEIIARTGDSAGGTSSVFSGIAIPTINNVGQISYLGVLLEGFGGVTSTNSNGLWRDNTLVVRAGDSASGTTGVFSSFNPGITNNAGQFAYLGFLLSGSGGVTSSNNRGLWRDTALIARTGNNAGGTTGIFSAFNSPVFNDAGQAAYQGFLLNGTGGVTTSNNLGLWRDSTLIARSGSSAAGTSGVFSTLDSPIMNSAGQLAYFGILLNGVGGVTSSNDRGLWRDSSLIARSGDNAGGTNGVFRSFGGIGINSVGQIAFQGTLQQGLGGVTASNDHGLWRDSTLMAREGNQANGTSGVFERFSNPLINNHGQLAYKGFLLNGTGGVTATNDTGVWLDSTLLAREGSSAAGTYNGEIFSSLGQQLVLNNGGQAAFIGSLQINTAGVSSQNNDGLWLYGPNGEGLLVAREGNIFDGRTLSSFGIVSGSGGGDGRPTSLNEFGQLAYRATFTDFSNAIVRYTPEIHWTANFSSTWDASSRWTLAIKPGDPHEVFIDPDASLTVHGPSNDVDVRMLTIGGGNGIATLNLGIGAIRAEDGTIVTATGVLRGDGLINGGVTNAGEVRAENVTITNGLVNDGIVRGSTGLLNRINAKLLNNAGGEVRVGVGESLRLSGSEHSNNGQIEIASSGFELDGELNNNIGAQILADNATLRFNNDVNNNTGAQIFADNATLRFNGSLRNDFGAQIFADNATLRFNGGLANNGQLNVTFGGASLFGNIAIDSLGQVILSGNSNTTFFDNLSNKGELRVSMGSVATFFGDVSGPGNYTGTGSKFYEALFSPGSSPGLVIDEGDALFGSGAVIIMEIGGSTQGVEYDHYDVAGLLSLNGTLEVSLLKDYAPSEGEMFDLFDWGMLSGEFLTLDLSGAILGKGLAWDLSQLYSSGSLQVRAAPVPLPAGLWLMLSALSVIASKRR